MLHNIQTSERARLLLALFSPEQALKLAIIQPIRLVNSLILDSQISMAKVVAQIHAEIETTIGLCLGVLAGAIILKEIQQSRTQLKDYSRSLEQKVSDRTQALQKEILQRQAVEAALQAANKELKELAYLDGLTQIANRRRFDDQLIQEWHRMKREQLPLSLILCDVDYFKQYNDTYGHQNGDECLRHLAKAIAAAGRRSTDLVARYGGEEFVILLPNTPLAGAQEVATMIQSNIRDLQLPHQNSAVSKYVTASFGITSIIPNDNNDAEQLLLRVDKALYFAKRSGRDRMADS
jgi:diguanylate cyclase (GGDEF)-like protein